MAEPLEQQLLQTGLELLSAEPAERLSLRRVAQAVGVSHQAPYVHFGTKRRFLAAVAGVGLQQAADEAKAILDSSPDDPVSRLHALVNAYVAFIRARPHVHDLAFGPLVAKADHPLLQQAAIDHWNLLERTVAACQPPGTNDAEILRRAAVAWGTVYGIARLTTLGQIPASVPGDQSELLRMAVNTLHEGWRAGGSSATTARGPRTPDP